MSFTPNLVPFLLLVSFSPTSLLFSLSISFWFIFSIPFTAVVLTKTGYPAWRWSIVGLLQIKPTKHTDCNVLIYTNCYMFRPSLAHHQAVHSCIQWRTQEFFFWGGGPSTNSVEDRGQRGRGSGGGSPLVRGSGGSCNLVQEISFHMVKFS